MSGAWFFLVDENTQTIIYVAADQPSLLGLHLSKDEQDSLLKKLLLALLAKGKKVFTPLSLDGFYLEIRSARKLRDQIGFEFSMRMMNLSQPELGFRSFGLLLGPSTVFGDESLQLQTSTDDPRIRAQEKPMPKVLEMEPNQAGPLEKPSLKNENGLIQEEKEVPVKRENSAFLNQIIFPTGNESPWETKGGLRASSLLPFGNPLARRPAASRGVNSLNILKIPRELPEKALQAVTTLKSNFIVQIKTLKNREQDLQNFYNELARNFKLVSQLPKRDPELFKGWQQRFVKNLQAAIKEKMQAAHNDKILFQKKSLNDWLMEFNTAELKQVADEMQDFQQQLSEKEGLLRSFRDVLFQKENEFLKRLETLTLLEERVEAIKLTPLLEKRIRLTFLSSFYQLFLHGQEERAQNKIRWQQSFYQALRLSRLGSSWKEPLDQNLPISLYLEIDSYQEKLASLLDWAKIEPIYFVFQQALENAQSLLEWLDEILKRPGFYQQKTLVEGLHKARERIELQIRRLRFNQADLLEKTADEAADVALRLEEILPQLKETQSQVLGLEAQAGSSASHSKPECCPNVSGEKEALLAQAQLRLILAIQQAVTQVAFWNKQVSGFGGKKVLIWDVPTQKPCKLSVPDGIQEMLIVLNDSTYTIREKLEKIKDLASRRLGRRGFFSEKPWSRRLGTQEFYQLVARLKLDQAQPLSALSGLLESFVKDHSPTAKPLLACNK